MQNKIQLNSEISFDLQKLVRSRLLIQANSGGGKSYTIRKILEEAHGKIQQIVLDPEGEFLTLREKFDYLIISKEGDIQPSLKTAGLLAHKLLELNVSAIIDLYELGISERKEFVRRFLESMINAPKKLWHNCLVVVDEAHHFCPQKKESESTDAVNDLATKGRKRGFCAILATQRIAKLDKNAAGECNNKLIGRSSLDVDMKRAGDEIGFRDKEQILSLRNLQPGEFYVFGPAISEQVKKIKVGKVQTSHPEIINQKSGTAEVSPPTETIKAVLKKLIDLPQEAEKRLATEKELRTEITKLRIELARAKKETPKAVIDSGLLERKLQKEIEQKTVPLIRQIKKYENILVQIGKLSQTDSLKSDMMRFSSETKKEEAIRSNVKEQMRKPLKQVEIFHPLSNNDVKLGIGERRILVAVAQFQEGITREHLTILTGYKRSSRDAYLQRLRQKGFIEISDTNIIVTQDGIEELGSDYELLPTGSELQQKVMSRLPEGEKKILSILIQSYPDSIDREFLSEQTGYQRSSRDAYLQRLKARQLVKFHGRGIVSASEKLFD